LSITFISKSIGRSSKGAKHVVLILEDLNLITLNITIIKLI